jgi:hypothetical protein
MAERAQILFRGKDETAAAFASIQGNFKGVMSLARQFAPELATLFSVGGVIAFAKSAINAGDAMHDMAQRTGIAVESLSKWKFIAEQSGATLDSIQPGLKGLAKNMEDAARGGKDSSDAFARLGVPVKESSGALRGMDAVMLDLAEKFASMPDGAQKTALAVRVFGKAGQELIPTLNLGKAGIAELMATAEKLGLVMSTEAAAAADELSDSMNLITSAGTALSTQFLNQSAPAISQVARAMAEAARDGGIFAAAIRGFGEAWKVLLFGADPSQMKQQQDFVKKLTVDLAKLKTELKEVEDGNSGAFRRKSAQEYRNEIATIELTITSATAAMKLMEDQAKKPIATPKVGVEAGKLGDDPEKARKAAETLAKELRALKNEADELFIKDRDNTMEAMRLHREADLDRAASLAKLIEESDALYEKDRDATIARNEKKIEQDTAMRDRLYANLFNERETLRASYEADFDALNDLNARKIVSNEQYYVLMGRLVQKHTKDQLALVMSSGTKQEKFAALTQGKQAAFLINSLVEQTAGVAQYSRKMFEINKVAGIANVAMKMPEAIADAFAFGTKFGGPVLGGIMAGIAGAAMAVQMAAIQSATFGGGGGGTAPSLAGGTPALPVSPVGGGTTGGGQTTIINLQGGDTFSKKQVRELVEKINESTQDGGRIVIA